MDSMTPTEELVFRLLLEGEKAGTWNVYLHSPKFRHLEGEMSRAIRAAYALLGIEPMHAREIATDIEGDEV